MKVTKSRCFGAHKFFFKKKILSSSFSSITLWWQRMDYTLSLLSAQAGVYPTLPTKLNKKIDEWDFLQQCVKKKCLKPVYISPSKSIWRENRISSDHSEMSRERSSPQLSLISSGIPISVFAEPSSWWRLFRKYIQEIALIRLKLPDYLYCSQLATLI